MSISWAELPALNAFLNGACAVLLIAAYAAIRAGRVPVHRALMVAAFSLSTLFLISYLAYHAHAGVVRFRGKGLSRGLYLGILSTHTLLAVVNVPLLLRTLFLAARGRFVEHRRLARWAFPSWLYVSATGVIVYAMLYRMP